MGYMRIRTIKPSFFSSDTVAELKPLTRILFIGLWGLADSEGRLEDRPKRIKVEVLPYDDYDINAALVELQEARFILRYENEGQKVIEVCNFKKHQRLSGREVSENSDFAPPPENTLGSIREAIGKHSGSNREAVNVQERKGKERKGRIITCSENEKIETEPENQTDEQIESKRLALLLATLHRSQIDKDWEPKTTHVEGWEPEIEKLIRIDHRKPVDIEAVIRWVKTPGCFWNANILSGSKLREKFPQLLAQMRRDKPNQPGEGANMIDMAKRNYREGRWDEERLTKLGFTPEEIQEVAR